MVACMLAFDLDGENARHYIPRTSLYKSARKEGYSIVQDFLAFLIAEDYGSLTCGSSYLWCVLWDAWVHVHTF